MGTYMLACNIRVVVSSEPPGIEWDSTYGTTSEEKAYHMIQTHDRGYAMVGNNVAWMQMQEGGRDFWKKPAKTAPPLRAGELSVTTFDTLLNFQHIKSSWF